MPSQYVVVQYGHVTSGEYLNVGVYVYDMDPNATEVKSDFVQDLSRIQKAFGKDRIFESLLENWLKKITTKEQMLDALQQCNSPYSSLQMTPPRASLLSPDDLLKSIVPHFLIG